MTTLNLEVSVVTDFLIWRRVYFSYMEQYIEGFMSESTLANRMADLGFTTYEIQSELQEINDRKMARQVEIELAKQPDPDDQPST